MIDARQHRLTLVRNTQSTDRFELSSLPQFGDGITGLNWSAVAPKKGSAPAVAGEKADTYSRFLERTERERPPAEGTVTDAVDERLRGAAADYRRLSGYWAAHGQFRDANSAYTHSRRLERRAASPWFAVSRRIAPEGRFALPRDQRRGRRSGWSIKKRLASRDLRPIRWVGLWVADVTTCFGQSLTRVFATLASIVLLPSVAYTLWHGVDGAHDIFDDLLFSMSRLTPDTPAGLSPANQVVEWAGILQAILGIGLVGLFGYVLGNVIRQS